MKKITEKQIEEMINEVDLMVLFEYQNSLEIGSFKSINNFMVHHVHIDYDTEPYYLAIERLLESTMKHIGNGKWEQKDILD